MLEKDSYQDEKKNQNVFYTILILTCDELADQVNLNKCISIII